jgi:hypothetical protein
MNCPHRLSSSGVLFEANKERLVLSPPRLACDLVKATNHLPVVLCRREQLVAGFMELVPTLSHASSSHTLVYHLFLDYLHINAYVFEAMLFVLVSTLKSCK